MSREERLATIERDYPREDVAEAVRQIAKTFDTAKFELKTGFTKLAGNPRGVWGDVGVFDVYGYTGQLRDLPAVLSTARNKVCFEESEQRGSTTVKRRLIQYDTEHGVISIVEMLRRTP